MTDPFLATFKFNWFRHLTKIQSCSKVATFCDIFFWNQLKDYASTIVFTRNPFCITVLPSTLIPCASAEIFPGGETSTFRLSFFRLRKTQCKWTFTKRFSLSRPQSKLPMKASAPSAFVLKFYSGEVVFVFAKRSYFTAFVELGIIQYHDYCFLHFGWNVFYTLAIRNASFHKIVNVQFSSTFWK